MVWPSRIIIQNLTFDHGTCGHISDFGLFPTKYHCYSEVFHSVQTDFYNNSIPLHRERSNFVPHQNPSDLRYHLPYHYHDIKIPFTQHFPMKVSYKSCGGLPPIVFSIFSHGIFHPPSIRPAIRPAMEAPPCGFRRASARRCAPVAPTRQPQSSRRRRGMPRGHGHGWGMGKPIGKAWGKIMGLDKIGKIIGNLLETQ